jgi:hypothetical protein
MRLMTLGVLVALVAALPMSLPASAQRSLRCLHDGSETPPNRQRRLNAIELARAINQAERRSPRPRMYRPLEDLQNLPGTPEGFQLQLHTDGTSYLFALKDTMDRCRYSIFSDEDGDIYEAIARPDVRVIPLDSQ